MCTVDVVPGTGLENTVIWAIIQNWFKVRVGNSEKKSFCTNKNVFKKGQILYVCKLYYIQGTYF